MVKKVKCKDSQVQSTEKSPHLLNFLLERKRITEYTFADVRSKETSNILESSHHIDKRHTKTFNLKFFSVA